MDLFDGETCLAFHSKDLNFNLIASFDGSAKDVIQNFEDLVNREIGDESISFENIFIEEKYNNETIYILDSEKIEGDFYGSKTSFTIIDETLILSATTALLKETIISYQNNETSPLLDDPLFQQALDDYDGDDFLAYINIKQLIEFGLNKLSEEKIEVPQNPFGVTKESILNALAFDKIQTYHIATSIEEDRIDMTGKLYFEEKTGLLSLLHYDNKTLPSEVFVPTDALNASMSNWNINESFQNLEKIISEISPQVFGIYNMQVEQLKIQMGGLDIRKDIIGNLGNDIVYYSSTEEAENDSKLAKPADQFFALNLSDSQAIQTAFETIKSTLLGGAKMLEESEYLGKKIFSFNPPQAQKGIPQQQAISYAFTDNYLYIAMGSIVNIQRSISNEGKEDLTLWKTDEVEDLIDQLPKNPTGIEYLNFENLTKSIMKQMSVLNKISGKKKHDKNDPKEIFAELLLESNISIPVIIIGASYEKNDHFEIHSTAIEKTPEH